MTSLVREFDLKKNISQLMRAYRRENGYSQEYISPWLGVDRTGVARIENGQRDITLEQWASFASATSIPWDSYYTGTIDRRLSATLQEKGHPNPFNLPMRYRDSRGSTVRSLQPILEFARRQMGDGTFANFLQARGIDPLFFVNFDNHINHGFALDVFVELVRRGHLGKHNIGEIAKAVQKPEIHGHLHHLYDNKQNITDKFVTLIDSTKFLDVNHKYEILDHTSGTVDVSVTPYDHMWAPSFMNHFVLGNLRCRYHVSYLQNFAAYRGMRDVAHIESSECTFKGDSRCVYKIAV